MEKLDCKTAKCEYIKCILKDTEINSDYFVKVKTRIWSGTFISATYQTIELTSNFDVETSNPDLLIIGLKQLPFGFFKRKYKQLQMEDDDTQSRAHVDEVL